MPLKSFRQNHDFLKLDVIIMSIVAVSVIASIPLVLPNGIQDAHAANANLFVSAENSQYGNYFAGPQVIQVVVADPAISGLNTTYGEPVVTINGKRLRMAQATDGNWYGYFADSKQAQIADSTAIFPGKGLDFGVFCSASSSANATGVSFSETKGIAVARGGILGSTNGVSNPSATIASSCTGHFGSSSPLNHVVRESKSLNSGAPGHKLGQISLNNNDFSKAWPVIQLYDFSSIPSAVTVDYQRGGGDQIVVLTFDRIPTNMITTHLDKTTYANGVGVFVTMNDPQLNIDPTEEDSWTWGANPNNQTLFYQAFDRSGNTDADGTPGMNDLIGHLAPLMFNHNGKFTLDPSCTTTNPVTCIVGLQSTMKQQLIPNSGYPDVIHTHSISSESEPVTFTESGGVASGVFENWDVTQKSNIYVTTNATMNGKSASIRYNDVSQSIVSGTFVPGTLFYRNSHLVISDSQDGTQYFTPLRTVDEDNKPLNIIYETDYDVYQLTQKDTVPADTSGCRGPSVNGLFQEGLNWNIGPTAVNVAGLSVKWRMPDATISGQNVGIIYNPVNFHATNTDPRGTTFFQIDWGVGDLSTGVDGFGITIRNGNDPQGGYEHYTPKHRIPENPGGIYVLDAAVENNNDPSVTSRDMVYVVQITDTSTVPQTSHVILAHPAQTTNAIGVIGKVTSIQTLQSFQDQYIENPDFHLDTTADEISEAKAISFDSDGSPILESVLSQGDPIDGALNWPVNTFDLLSPSTSANMLKNSQTCTCKGGIDTSTNTCVTFIPFWIKNVAKKWHDNDPNVNDATYLGTLQYMIQNNIMIIPTSSISVSSSGAGSIPSWVKNDAGWWADGTIDDNTYIESLAYLIQKGFIILPPTTLPP